MAEKIDRLTELRYFHAHSITAEKTVQSFPTHEGEENTFVVVDGVAYRREDDQEELLLHLRECDLRRDFLDRFGLEAFDALFEIGKLSEEDRDAREERLMEKLIGHLPRHEKTIRHCLWPDDREYDLMIEDLHEQAPCLVLIPGRPSTSR